LFDYKKFKTVDFGSASIEGLKELTEMKMEQTAQPSFS
jgi:transcription-repair coupling factor (superfamily II helicase)